MGGSHHWIWRSVHGTEHNVQRYGRDEGFPRSDSYVRVAADAVPCSGLRSSADCSDPEFFRDGQYHGSVSKSGADGNGYRHVYYSWL